MFVENEVLVNRRDAAGIAFLVGRFGGEAIEPTPIPERPGALNGAPTRDIRDLPQMLKVRIRGDAVPLEALDRLLERNQVRDFKVSSRQGAGTLAASLLLREQGLGGQPNFAGTVNDFPLSTSTEGAFAGDNDAYQWPEYTGKSNITMAWQLCQSLDNVRSMRNPVFIGVIDCGFGFVTPNDYATGLAYNLTNPGASILGPTDIGNYAWHGSGVAGIAAAVVNNNIGAGGVGGLPVGPARLPVAMAFMFSTHIDSDEIYACLLRCVAWGIEVLNMSISITIPNFLSDFWSDWDDYFRIAHERGLIVVAAAGNNGENLPEDLTILPATRTPGVITVGALNADGNTARGDSNYGSSVDVWAPGTNIHTVPDPVTSPVFLSVHLRGRAHCFRRRGADEVRQLRAHATEREGHLALLCVQDPASRANRILNAYRAVLSAINDALPPGTFEEPNNTPATAKPMIIAGPNLLQPLGETTFSNGLDWDFHRFNTAEYADITVVLNYVRPLGGVGMELLAHAMLPSPSPSGQKALTVGMNRRAAMRVAVHASAARCAQPLVQ
jgi:hypothetical protein